jgi:cytochrome c oxidase cbb3-type subunit 2
MNARFVALVAGVGFFFLAVVTQGILPFVSHSADRAPHRVRAQLGQLKWLVTEATLTRWNNSAAVYICARLLVLPFAVRSSDRQTRRWGRVVRLAIALRPFHLFGHDASNLIGEVGLKYGDEGAGRFASRNLFPRFNHGSCRTVCAPAGR